MTDFLNTDERRPPGERIARVEAMVADIREDVTEIKAQLAELTEQKVAQDAYVKLGKAVWGVTERVLLVLFGSAAGGWLQRHWPGMH